MQRIGEIEKQKYEDPSIAPPAGNWVGNSRKNREQKRKKEESRERKIEIV